MNLTGHPDVGVNHECDGISKEIQPCRLSTTIATWAVGGSVSNHYIKFFYILSYLYDIFLHHVYMLLYVL